MKESTKSVLLLLLLLIVHVVVFRPWAGFWQETEPSQATGMTLARCILGTFLGVVCHCFPLHVPQNAALLVAKGGTVGENGVR
jgi:hypothetical protein